MKDRLSGSLVNEMEVAEYEFNERQRAKKNLQKVKNCPIECSKKPIRIGGVFNEVRYIR